MENRSVMLKLLTKWLMCLPTIIVHIINYISSKVTYSFVILAAEVGYFVAESIANEAITKWFE